MPLANEICFLAAMVLVVKFLNTSVALLERSASISTVAVSDAAAGVIRFVTICRSATRAWFHASKKTGRQMPLVTKRGPQSQPY